MKSSQKYNARVWEIKINKQLNNKKNNDTKHNYSALNQTCKQI